MKRRPSRKKGKTSTTSDLELGSSDRPAKKGDSPQRGRVRIVGGSMRGRSIEYRVDPGTRPMKDRTREALFNLLGGDLTGFIAFDLFGGTGILGIESISRGADQAIIIEWSKPIALQIRNSVAALGLQDRGKVVVADALRWDPKLGLLDQSNPSPVDRPWLVYICPPYSFWKEKRSAMQELLDRWAQAAPAGSLIAIEFEEPAPLEMLPSGWDWDARKYLPAIMAVGERQSG